ncbi:MGMT family protein [Candidatus Nitronereus thalassa]|uniref:MGMT family protein n=1 Tax=Candidatus Nitronereus thalassa TaxID=3020898 RepID=A0ABU3K3S4_9BACT|nr:MGMT family protein [Candidatus Nitronereus thalassa]MDT7041038.1 MGMT family protein [Candidatus Nitronereus thalassa]
MASTYETIYGVVKKIPRGCVATYGQIADLAGLPGQPRQVGYALNALRRVHSIPWHRVINAKGEISQRSQPGCEKLQRRLLEGEGLEFDGRGRVSLAQFCWKPRTRR